MVVFCENLPPVHANTGGFFVLEYLNIKALISTVFRL